MTDYKTRYVSKATVRTITHYADFPEVREYTVYDNEELGTLLMDMRNPEHGEWVFDVDVKEWE